MAMTVVSWHRAGATAKPTRDTEVGKHGAALVEPHIEILLPHVICEHFSPLFIMNIFIHTEKSNK